jgi:aryl-alcohol dehydrogenase-like predicted oxidoreductase
MRAIGSTRVSSIALGCAALTFDHYDDPARSAAVINAALDAGMTLLDTAAAHTHASHDHGNERLIREVLAARSPGDPRPLVATKGGHYRHGDAFPVDARPATLRRHCDGSLTALTVECIDLYFLHWPDLAVPVEESVGALDDLRREGKIAQIGVSNVSLAELGAAQRTAPVAAVQNHFSVFDQSGGDVLDHCTATGTAFLAYSPLRGLSQATHELTQAIAEIAGAHGVGPARIALAWLLARSPVLIPVVGATRPYTARDAAAAESLVLGGPELAALRAEAGC